MIVVNPIDVVDATLVGQNEVVNGGFDADTDWTKGTGWTIAGGVASKASGTGSQLSQSWSTTGELTVTFTISNYVAGTITPRFIGGATVTGTARSANGTFTEFITPNGGVTDFELNADSSGDFDIDNVEIGSIGSNVPETDNAEWDVATPYIIGDVVMVSVVQPDIHKNFEAVAASTGTQPWTDDGTTWLDLGATNRWKMFDTGNSSATDNPNTIDVSITPGRVVTAVVALNISATEIQVQVDDPVEGIVYDTTKNLIADSGINDWHAYYFTEIERETDVAFLDLPSYGEATINVTATESGQTVSIGVLAIGPQSILGTTNHGTGVGMLDFSVKETDSFGNITINQRGFSDRPDYDITVNTNRVSAVKNFLDSIRTTPVVWIGSENIGATIVFGYYREYDILLSTPTISDMTITVEGTL